VKLIKKFTPILLTAILTASAFATVTVTKPGNGVTAGSPVNFVAAATTDCPKGVASMGIYTAPFVRAYVGAGASLNTSLTLNPGTYNTVIVEWDYCGGATTAAVKVVVSGASGTTISNLQSGAGWTGYGELAPVYAICTTCSPQVTWAMTKGVKTPSMTGNATRFDIGGTVPYSDVLWDNHLIGDLSSQGLPDSSRTLVAKYHHFTYDVYFYGAQLNLAQSLEFDVAQFFDNLGYYWGTECRVAGGHQWAVWDNLNAKWVATGIACNPVSNSWNHLVLQFQRTSDNHLVYQSITLNGITTPLNWSFDPYSTPNWYGIVLNFQPDGNSKQTPYSVYLDNLNFTYE
jgi:hypothetical protein